MDLLDWIIVLVTFVSAVHGLRVGAATQILSYVGALAGLVVGFLLVPVVLPHLGHGYARTFFSLLLLLVPCGLCWGIGRQAGTKLWGRIQSHPVRHLDAAAGAAIAMAGTLVFSWLIGVVLVNSPVPEVAGQIEHSVLLRGITSVMPPVPTELASLEHLLDGGALPLPVIDFTGPEPPVTMPDRAEVNAAVARAGLSTVKITAYGCDHGDLVENGSGFVVNDDLVVTNAHVVAGALHVVVTDQVQDYLATVILFDPEFDLAVLRAPGLSDPSLRLDSHLVGRGTKAVVLGYPEGGPFNAQPAGVLARLDATGFDIYNRNETTRRIYELQAQVRPGNSGGPLVEPNGLVVGVVFSRLLTDSEVGFALASPGVLKRVEEAAREGPRASVSTQRCVTG